MTSEELIKDVEETFRQCLDIVRRKNADYGGAGTPWKNFEATLSFGVEPEVGFLVRMTDKLSRVSTLLKADAQVKDETINDTLIDLVNYSALLKSFIKYKHDKLS